MLELRMQTCAGSSEPLSHYETMSVDSFNFNRAGSRALHACADPEHFVRGGSERTEMPLKMDHHRPINETPLKWRFAGVSMAHLNGPPLNAGLVAL